MWIYLLKFSACLSILLLFYKVVLEKVHLHHFKRYYLLSAFIISLSIPLITFTHSVIVTLEPAQIPTFIDQTRGNFIDTKTNTAQTLPIILWGIYILGVFIFALKFLGNLRSLLKNIKNNPKLKSGRIHHVLLQELIAPHTFFSYIFFNKKNYEDQKIPKEVFWHEETHAIQKHSLDILLLELLQIVFWFHPLIYWAKHLVKLNHEFLADQTVLKKGASVPDYQNMVLAFSSNAIAPPLANTIHYSSTRLKLFGKAFVFEPSIFGQVKKRIVIMKTQTTKKAIWLKSLLLIPLLALLLYSFSSTHIAQKIKLSEQKLPSLSKDSVSGATESMMQEYRAFTDNLQKSETHIIKMPEYQRIEAIYELMTDKQLASVTDYKDLVKTPNLNISKTKSIEPSPSLYESWKDSKKYAIWIDGKHVSNTILDRYNSSDIVHFTSSFVYNNARSQKFPQPYQNRLYTKNGFEEAYSKYSINKYNELSDQYREEIKSFHKKDQLDNSELRILKVRLDRLYNSFSKEELEKHRVLAPAPVPNPTPIMEKRKPTSPPPPAAPQTSNGENKTENEKNAISTFFSHLEKSYVNMTAGEKKLVHQPYPPSSPKTSLNKTVNGDKESNEKPKIPKKLAAAYGNLYTVPQPPPQPNKDPVKYIKELAEKGATFYMGPHQYKTDEVIGLVKKSKDPSIDVSDYPIVRLGGC